MKKMNFTEEEFDSLVQKNVDGYNTESNLYLYRKYLLKEFKNLYDVERKRIVLDAIDQNRVQISQDLEEILIPAFEFYVEDIYKGFGMKNLPGVTLEEYINDTSISFRKKLRVIIKVGLFLEKLDKLREINPIYQNLFINDLHAGNILVLPNGSIKILDVDSFRIGNQKGFPALYLETYPSPIYRIDKYHVEGDRIKANRESDLFCYIMLVLEVLTNRTFSGTSIPNFEYYMRKLKDRGLFPELVDSFKSIYDDRPNVNPVHMLKKIDKQIII